MSTAQYSCCRCGPPVHNRGSACRDCRSTDPIYCKGQIP